MKVPTIAKLIGLSIFSVSIVLTPDLRLLAGLGASIVVIALILGAWPGRLLKMLVPAMPFLLLIALFQWLISGIDLALLSFGRMLLLYVAGSAVTLTTTEAEFVQAVQMLLWPISRVTGTNIGRDIATMMMLAIAFLPIIKEEHDAIRLAQEARGVSFDGPVRYLKGEIYTIIPLVNAVSARADRIALAMEARCYGINFKR